MIRVLIVGQTPPPLHGQALMIQRLLQGRFTRVQRFHVRMRFSDSIGDVGRFRIGKLLHLFGVVVRIIYHRLVHRVEVLYYPPAGPNRVPVYRDIAILLCTRWMFRRTVFHFHATGISQLYPQLNRVTRFLFRLALFHPDAIIRITNCGPDDGLLLRPRREFIVPNGIEDEYEGSAAAACGRHTQFETNVVAQKSAPLRILFVAMLRESKGLLVLIDACRLLAMRGVPFTLQCAGQFESAEFASLVRARVDQLHLQQQINFLGVVSGASKWQAYARSDVLCLPTHFECETFPTVLLEAMSFKLPVIATRWRGIPDIVDDGENGLLIDLHDSDSLADCLQQLHANSELRQHMGKLGREKFLSQFTAQRHLERMQQVFVEVATSAKHPLPTSESERNADSKLAALNEEVVC